MKKMYAFDFDGTLTYKDSMFLFLRFYNPSKFRLQFLRHLPLFVLLKIKLADAEKVKRSLISSILKGQTEETLEKKANQFFKMYYPQLIRENALDFITHIQKEKVDSYIVSASLDLWVKPFSDFFGMTLVATKAQYVEGVFTGEFDSKNCNGQEKVVRIKQETQGKKYDKTIAFGDTSGDKAMLEWADEGFFKFFH